MVESIFNVIDLDPRPDTEVNLRMVADLTGVSADFEFHPEPPDKPRVKLTFFGVRRAQARAHVERAILRLGDDAHTRYKLEDGSEVQ